VRRLVPFVIALAACGGGGGDDGDDDDDVATVDAMTDAATIDAGADCCVSSDAAIDAATDAATDAPMIDAVPPTSDNHIHIYVSNTCVETVSPTEITVPANQTAYFDWHNHSADYAIDVWMSYGGGYTDLATGATWDEPVSHCSTPLVHDEYADISTACSSFRFLIHCN
jgi:hypothetical protein